MVGCPAVGYCLDLANMLYNRGTYVRRIFIRFPQYSCLASSAWYISDRTPPHDSGDIINPFYYNVQNDSSRPPSKTVLGDISNHPVWIALSSDIFTGQIIASMIVVIFVAIFLLREWISQNARPGVFDGEEMPAAPEERPAEAAPLADADRPQAPDPEEHPIFPAMNLQDRLALAERQMEAVRALDHMQALRRGQKQRRPKNPAQGRPRRNSSAGETSGSRALGDEAMTKQDERDEFRKQQRAFSRRLYVARMSNAMRREEERGSGSGSGSASPPSPPPVSAPIPSSAGWANDFTFTPPEMAKFPVSSTSSPGPGAESPFPSVVMQPPSASLPFSFNQSTNSPASTSSAPTTPFRRPPLPNTVLPSPGPSSPVRVSPMVSPGLATYRAPEDLNPEAEAEAGPSSVRANGYFDSTSLALDDEQDQAVPEPEEDMDHYFRPEAEADEEDAETLRNESEDDRPLSPGTDEQEEDEEEEGADVDVDDEALDVEEPVAAANFNEERPAPPPQENVGGGDEAQDAAMAAGLNEDLDGADDDMEGALEGLFLL